MTERKPAKRFRSLDWFAAPGRNDMAALYLERFMNYGMTPAELRSGKPIVGIAQSGSDLNPCNRHHLELAKRVRDGIRDAGGIPIEFPTHPIFENCRRPTAAIDRNLAFMTLVELLRGYPLDAVVLTTGCDKTTPSAIMAATAVDIPAIVLSGGPMLDGWHEGELVGSGTVIWRSRRKLAAGEITEEEFLQAACDSAPSAGHCNTMGTASTMNAVAEALGLSLPGCSAIPAPYRERGQMAYETGKRIVDMAFEDMTPSRILTRAAFLNAIATVAAIGGSTNAQPHIVAMARHAGVELDVADWSQAHDIPLLLNMQPSGKYLGERFHRAGGVPAILCELLGAGRIDGGALTCTGHSLAKNIEGRETHDREMIRPYDQPLMERAGFLVLKGNLFDFAIMKTSVISADFRKRYLSRPGAQNVFEGRAAVFDGSDDYHHRINDPALGIDADTILVIRGSGPVGWPGSAEVVNM
ncbi:MAG TPA: IlvD/Edd family dehydratase, partial [Rhizomicrobium sp.]